MKKEEGTCQDTSTCQEAESLQGAGGSRTEALCEGEARVWAMLEEMSGAGVPQP